MLLNWSLAKLELLIRVRPSMSSSIAIPQRKKKELGSGGGSSVDSAGSSANLSSSSGRGFGAYGSFGSNAEASEPSSSSLRNEGKMRRQSLMCKLLSGSSCAGLLTSA